MKRMIQPSARCRALLLELSRYLEGELTPARCRAIERHLDDCTCCTTMAKRLRRSVNACRAAGQERLPPEVQRRARERIRKLLGETP